MIRLAKETKVICCAFGAFIFGPIIFALQGLKTHFFGDSTPSIMAVTGGTCPMVAVSRGTLRPHVKSLSLGAGVTLALELAIVCIVSVGWITLPSTQSDAASTFLRTDIICRSTVGHQRREFGMSQSNIYRRKFIVAIFSC
jgi:hypothetical protein